MPENDCTTSGARLWAVAMCIGLSILLLETVEMALLLGSNPDRTREILTAISLIGSGTIIGLAILHQGLTNSAFLLPMRVMLVAIGFPLTMGSLFSGIRQIASLS